MSSYDQHLAQYRHGTEEVWCTNRECPNHESQVTVQYESEYGQSWWTPEECFLCGHEWTQDQPKEEEEDA